MTARARPRRRWQPMAHPARAATAELMADISANNAGFDAVRYKAAGHVVVMIKATQGAEYVNYAWARWTAAAHAAGLAVVHYHFANGEDPLQEAQHLWQTVRPHFAQARDRLLVDIEGAALEKLGPGAPGWLVSFDMELHRLSGLWTLGYTDAASIEPLVLHSGKWLIASWGTGQPSGRLRRLPHGQTLWGWQYTDGQTDQSGGPRAAAGIGVCDMSVLSPPIVDLIRRSVA